MIDIEQKDMLLELDADELKTLEYFMGSEEVDNAEDQKILDSINKKISELMKANSIKSFHSGIE